MGPVDVQQVTVSIHTRPIVAGNSLSEDDTRVEETHESSVFEEHGSDPVSDENIDEMQSTGLKHKYDIVAVYILIYSICVLKRIHFELRDHYPQIILEIGCGSGIVSAFVNLAMGRNVLSLATDLNPHALECTLETSRLNGTEINVIQTDLEKGLDQLQKKVDLLLFNPPYVPTENDPENDLERCWVGGISGRGTLDRLLPHVPFLLSSTGVFYLVALHSNDIASLLCYFPSFKGSVVMERRCGIEHLYILKFCRRS
uniref:Methyltransferase HEMK2 n=1 Tax=Heterorhabditis bacteriophora TaxID=37862 RepID=A0A1I7XMW9_HETBA